MYPEWHTSSKFINAWGDESTAPHCSESHRLCRHFLSERLHALGYNSCPLRRISCRRLFFLFFFFSLFLSSSSRGDTSTRKSAKCLSCCTFLILQTVDDVHFYKALLSSPGEEKKKRNRRIMCVCLLVIRCISSLSFLFNDWLLQRGGLYFWSVMILLSGDLKVGKGVKKGTMKGGKILPSFCGFEQPLICTKFRFALLFFQIKDSRESIIQS